MSTMIPRKFSMPPRQSLRKQAAGSLFSGEVKPDDPVLTIENFDEAIKRRVREQSSQKNRFSRTAARNSPALESVSSRPSLLKSRGLSTCLRELLGEPRLAVQREMKGHRMRFR